MWVSVRHSLFWVLLEHLEIFHRTQQAASGAVVEAAPRLVYLWVRGQAVKHGNPILRQVLQWYESKYVLLHVFCVCVLCVVCRCLNLQGVSLWQEEIATGFSTWRAINLISIAVVVFNLMRDARFGMCSMI